MRDNNNDIKKLFQSFGADANSFRELARTADAKAAESRWPLLSAVQPEKRDLPPLLSKAEKTQSWTAPMQHAQRSVKAPGPQHGLGERLSGSLRQQLQAKEDQSVRQTEEAVRPAMRAPVRARPQPERAAAAPEKRLFSAAGEKSRKDLPEDALSSVFQRISAPAKEKPKPKPAASRGLLGRLGRP